MANKIKYGLKNVYYAKLTVTEGVEAYDTPVAIPGAVNLTLDADGDISKFYADDVVYFQSASNNGYSGSLEIALIPDSFKKDILGEAEDTNGLLVEKADAIAAPFALMFEFSGDDKAKRVVMYNVTATRPSVSGATKAESIEPQTETLNISAVPNADGYVKASLNASTSTTYTGWFTSVQTPSFT